MKNTPHRIIPLSVPTIGGNEWQYLKECLDTEWVSSAGRFVDKFETDFAAYVGAASAVACVNGTAALQVALRVVGVRTGDEVIVPTLTFISTVNAACYLGAEPVFMDCDDYYNIDLDKLTDFLDTCTEQRDGDCYNRTTGRRLAAIVPVHVFGNAVAMDNLIALCRPRGIAIVEDAAESLGTSYLDGRHTGTLGDMGCFSFNGNKIITTGGGGMIVTDNSEYAAKARYLTTQAKDDAVRYIHDEVGYNFRLTNIQAALGVAQMERLPEFLAVKQRNFILYRDAIANMDGLVLAEPPAYAHNNLWMYALQIDKERYRYDREALMAYLKEHGIQTRPVWQLNHLQRPYLHCRSWHIERAPQLLATTLNIPCSVNLCEEDVDFIIERLRCG
jgi:aminotransferase in exopolysaccharide biosynthesis